MAGFQPEAHQVNESTMSNATQYLLPFVPSSFSHAADPPQYPIATQHAIDDVYPYSAMPGYTLNQPSLEMASRPYFPNAYNSSAPHQPDVRLPINNGSMQDVRSSSQNLDSHTSTEAEGSRILSEGSKFVKSESPASHTSRSSIHPGYLQYSEDAFQVPPIMVANSNVSRAVENSDSSSPLQMPRRKRRRSCSSKPIPSPLNDAEVEWGAEKLGLQISSTRQSIDSFDAEPTMSEAEFKQNLEISAKASHSLVERKYRQKLNSKLDLLGQTLALTRNFEIDMDANEKTTSVKPPKAEVLDQAMRYINRAEFESAAYIKEIEFLRSKVATYEKLSSSREWNQTSAISRDMRSGGDRRQYQRQ